MNCQGDIVKINHGDRTQKGCWHLGSMLCWTLRHWLILLISPQVSVLGFFPDNSTGCQLRISSPVPDVLLSSSSGWSLSLIDRRLLQLSHLLALSLGASAHCQWSQVCSPPTSYRLLRKDKLEHLCWKTSKVVTSNATVTDGKLHKFHSTVQKQAKKHWCSATTSLRFDEVAVLGGKKKKKASYICLKTQSYVTTHIPSNMAWYP